MADGRARTEQDHRDALERDCVVTRVQRIVLSPALGHAQRKGCRHGRSGRHARAREARFDLRGESEPFRGRDVPSA